MFSAAYAVFSVVWHYPNSKLKDKQYKQKTSPKTEIKILANPGLAESIEQPGLLDFKNLYISY